MTHSRRKLLLTIVVILIAAAVIGLGTWANFSSTTTNPGNTFEAGTVVLTDNDAGSAMFNLTDLAPNDTASECIIVSYSGSLPASVRLYGTTGGTGLDQYLDLTVTRGTVADNFSDCTGFTPDVTDYNGDGAGVVFDGTLQSYPDSYAAGIVDPTPGSPETWNSGESHAYRFTVTQQDNNAAQGLDATQAFSWQAQNE